MSETDLQLLARYSHDHAEEAFAELVRRHVDFVYSAALRQVRSSQLAEEVAQSVFIDLARAASRMKPDTILTAWLHQVARCTAIDSVRRETRRQQREQIATALNAMNTTEATWREIEPVLDEAVAALEDTDRAAVLLRYFENKSLRDVGRQLGVNDDAAQKRVSRAVERLREFFTKRGVTVGAGGLAIVISANAVQAAPVGLAVTISAAALAGTATSTSTVIAAATKTIAMTTLQKTIVATTVAVLAGAGIYKTHQAAQLREQIQTLQKQQSPLTEQIRQLQQEHDAATDQLAGLIAENTRWKSDTNQSELLRLRGEVNRLLEVQHQLAQTQKVGVDPNDPAVQHFLSAKAQAQQIATYLEQMPNQKIPELKLLTDIDWLTAAKEAKFDNDADVRQTLSNLRKLAKSRLPLGRALFAFTSANNGQLPADISELKPYFQSALGDSQLDDATLDAVFARYKLLHTGNLDELPQNSWIIAEASPVDKDFDSRAKFGNGTSTIINNGTARSYAEGENTDTPGRPWRP